MKKILATLILGLFVIGIVAPAIVVGADPTPPQKPKDFCTLKNDKLVDVGNCPAAITPGTTPGKGLCCLLDSILTITDWVFYILMTIVIIMFVWGGGYYITAAGDPEKAKKGQEVIVLAIIGLVIALLAKLAPSIIRFIVGL